MDERLRRWRVWQGLVGEAAHAIGQRRSGRGRKTRASDVGARIVLDGISLGSSLVGW